MCTPVCYEAAPAPKLPSVYVFREMVAKVRRGQGWRVEGDKGPLFAKVLDKADLTEAQRGNALREAKCLSQCRHPFVVELVDYTEDDDTITIFTRFAQRGDLRSALHRRKSHPNRQHFSDGEIITMLVQLLLAVDAVHAQGILHRDLKSSNVMVGDAGEMLLGDFGLSKFAEENPTSLCGTPVYVAPEVWLQAPYDAKADMWSLGVILYELLTLRRPFEAPTVSQVRTKVLRGLYDVPENGDEELLSILRSLLNTDSAQRPTAREVLSTSLTCRQELRRLAKVPELTACETFAKQVHSILQQCRDADVVMQGTVLRSHNGTTAGAVVGANWLPRRLCLTLSELLITTGEGETKAVPLRCVRKVCRTMADHIGVFTVVLSGGQTALFKAPCSADADAWVAAFRSCVH